MNTIKKIYNFYVDGFRSMTVGRRLWALIIIKLIIIFAILKVFFFPDIVSMDGRNTDEARANFVGNELLNPERGY
ncbi:MAG: DUF4492 domain-containing protein [Muribaculaceae bacterium]|nr:DUF4492 domain-containing protein [Muribaculaceae bacterium]MDE5845675.1 DUF4492 domain-containing protein [Muribaculaceae bacterium]MDE5858013.1 DUF4492 domain-containing protein [Muribaculaceae bacterium]MDE7154835.1 DUF4492 domain-containing protein [Muribaculaceae bacterium]MDE7368554.1 DUF4492 domain-containing protein [Muribaculaceae bacterium]